MKDWFINLTVVLADGKIIKLDKGHGKLTQPPIYASWLIEI
jgi:hypothetical protein